MESDGWRAREDFGVGDNGSGGGSGDWGESVLDEASRNGHSDGMRFK
jgi:hypothetical protein